MKISHFLTRFGVLMLVAGGFAGGCAHHRGGSTTDQLLRASDAAGVNIRREEVFSLSTANESFATAPIAGWEQIPATALRDGVNFAFATFAQEQDGVPAGSYTLRAVAQDIRLGTVPATVHLIGANGQVAREIQAEAEIHSLTVPAEAARSRTFVTAAAAAQLPNVGTGLTYVWYRCPNGVCIRMPVFRSRDFRMTTIAAVHDHR